MFNLEQRLFSGWNISAAFKLAVHMESLRGLSTNAPKSKGETRIAQ
jgi:hypothetical protein